MSIRGRADCCGEKMSHDKPEQIRNVASTSIGRFMMRKEHGDEYGENSGLHAVVMALLYVGDCIREGRRNHETME